MIVGQGFGWPAGPRAQVIKTGAAGDLVNPSEETGIVPKSRKIPVGLEKDLLRGVFRGNPIGKKDTAEPDHPLMITANQFRVRLPVPFEDAFYNFPVFDVFSPRSFFRDSNLAFCSGVRTAAIFLWVSSRIAVIFAC